jgi:transcriptional regulator with XRE-family HTH domain
MPIKVNRPIAKAGPRPVDISVDPFVHTHGEHTAAELSRDVDIAPGDLDALSASSKSVEEFASELPQTLIDWANDATENSGAVRAGTLLRTMRTKAGLSQAALGEQAQIKQSDISALETGSGERGPTFDVLARVADACGYHLTFAPKKPVPGKVRMRVSGHDIGAILVKSRSKKDPFETYLKTKFHFKPKGKVKQDIRELMAKALEQEGRRSVSVKALYAVTAKLKKNRTFMSYVQQSPGRLTMLGRHKARHHGRASASGASQAVKSR